jgi:hypothetical protein
MAETKSDEKRIQKSIWTARKNWRNWKNVFEHRGAISDNPLLADPKTFRKFCAEYSVGRTIRKGTRDSLRAELASSTRFSNAIHDKSGQALDKCESHLRKRFGTYDGTRCMISALSKVAAFVKPERFVAWDRYARKGLNIVLGRSASAPFESYAEYLGALNEAWNDGLGEQIKACLEGDRSHSADELKGRFLRRVLDVHLMRRGGRWKRKK